MPQLIYVNTQTNTLIKCCNYFGSNQDNFYKGFPHIWTKIFQLLILFLFRLSIPSFVYLYQHNKQQTTVIADAENKAIMLMASKNRLHYTPDQFLLYLINPHHTCNASAFTILVSVPWINSSVNQMPSSRRPFMKNVVLRYPLWKNEHTIGCVWVSCVK